MICTATPVSRLDQRGITRPQNGTCDIGAYELDNAAPTVSSSLRVNANPTNLTSVQFTVTFSESVTGVDVSDGTTTQPQADFIANWNGTNWSPPGTDLNGSLDGQVNAIAVMGTDIYVGRSFENLS